MASLIHIAEIAGLLFVAYMAGWTLGYLARRATARDTSVSVAEIPASRLAAATHHAVAEPDLVKTPVVAPFKPVPPPTAPQPAVEAREPAGEAHSVSGELGEIATVEPVPAGLELPAAEAVAPAPEPALVEPPPVISPPPAPIESIEPIEAAEVIVAEPLPKESLAEEPPPAPVIAPMPELVRVRIEIPPIPAMPASRPGEAWSGEVHGHAAPRHDAQLPPPVAAAPPASPVPEPDEDAAMRAIEGGWSRQSAHALPDEPELLGVSAAVAAAQSAVNKAIAKIEDEPAPPGGKTP